MAPLSAIMQAGHVHWIAGRQSLFRLAWRNQSNQRGLARLERKAPYNDYRPIREFLEG